MSARGADQQSRVVVRHQPESGLQLAALSTAVETPEYPREHDRHQQAPGSQNEHIEDATDVELADMAHQKISDHRIQRAAEHVHHRRRLTLGGRGM